MREQLFEPLFVLASLCSETSGVAIADSFELFNFLVSNKFALNVKCYGLAAGEKRCKT